MTDSDVIGGRKIYFYHLLLDKKVYYEGLELLKKSEQLENVLAYMNSHQPVEIFEDGEIHIVH